MVEFANRNDINDLKKLWQSVFLEDREITDIFFENIYDDCINPVIKINERIVSSVFLIPCEIGKYKGYCVYCAMTSYKHRGKGYMKNLLDFSYEHCKNLKSDFLFLIPAEKSLFDYYETCGYSKFGIRRKYDFNGDVPTIKEPLNFDCEIKFSDKVIDYWKKECVHYGGTIIDDKFSGLLFDDDVKVIKNANGNFKDIPKKYIENISFEGNIDFGYDESPAMIKTEKENLKNINCFIGITLE